MSHVILRTFDFSTPIFGRHFELGKIITEWYHTDMESTGP